MKDVLDLDATCLAEKIRNRELTSVQAAETFIRQIKTVNPLINAMVENRFAEALAEARECDALIREGKAKGRLFGVPITMKEALDVLECIPPGD